jgi:hypothetical protein
MYYIDITDYRDQLITKVSISGILFMNAYVVQWLEFLASDPEVPGSAWNLVRSASWR